MNTLVLDVQLAVRRLANAKIFTTVAIASLAIGIGANTAVFSVFSAVALRPLPYADQDRLVDLHEISATEGCAGCGFGTSYDGLLDWRARVRSVTAMAGYQEVPLNVSGTELPERISGAMVSANVFDVLGVQAQMGHVFEATDDRPAAPPVVLLSDRLWRQRYAADRRLVGQTIRINGVPHTVIGIMPEQMRFPEFAQLWIPLAPNIQPAPRSDRMLGVVARLRDGATLEQANREIASVAAAVATEHPDTPQGWSAAATLLRSELGGTERSVYGMILGAVTFVLLIVCATLAGLLLARGAGRQREIAVRLALGATRRRIIRQLLIEAVVLAVVGGAFGVLVAVWGIQLVLQSLDTPIPFWIEPRIDAPVLAYCFLVSIAVGLLFGLAPALRVSRPDVHAELKESGQAAVGGAGRTRLRAALVVAQVAMAMVLLAGAGVMVKAVRTVSAPDAGFDANGVLTANADLLDARFRDPSQLVAAASSLSDGLRAAPGVKAAVVTTSHFIAGFGASDQRITVEGMAAVPPGASPRFAIATTPGYFTTMGMSVVHGRDFDAGDRTGSLPVVIINAAQAERLWPGQSPVGHRIKLGGDTLPWRTVVGVSSDIRNGRDGAATPNAYLPFAQAPGAVTTILVRGAADPLALVPVLRRVVAALDRDTPLLGVQTLAASRRRSFSPYRAIAATIGGTAGVALVLAMLGLYGIVAFSTAQRGREIGLRIALGASRGDVIRLVTRQGAGAVALGIVIGLFAASLLLRVMRSVLFGAEPVDPVIFGLATCALAACGLLASYIPARRAMRIDPTVALRND